MQYIHRQACPTKKQTHMMALQGNNTYDAGVPGHGKQDGAHGDGKRLGHKRMCKPTIMQTKETSTT